MLNSWLEIILWKSVNAKMTQKGLPSQNCIFWLQPYRFFQKSHRNLRGIFYQMDHIWWAPSRFKKSQRLKYGVTVEPYIISFFNRHPVYPHISCQRITIIISSLYRSCLCFDDAWPMWLPPTTQMGLTGAGWVLWAVHQEPGKLPVLVMARPRDTQCTQRPGHWDTISQCPH